MEMAERNVSVFDSRKKWQRDDRNLQGGNMKHKSGNILYTNVCYITYRNFGNSIYTAVFYIIYIIVDDIIIHYEYVHFIVKCHICHVCVW